jgi:hypothetical protein
MIVRRQKWIGLRNLDMKDILLVLVGGICSALGGFLAAWYRARVAGKVKLQETIAERKVAAYGKGLELIGEVQSILVQGAKKDALDFLYDKGSWFADSLILLPHTFVENWRSIRLNLREAIMYDDAQEKMKDDGKRAKIVDRIVEACDFCDGLAKEAESSIRKELGLPECVIRHPPSAKTNA